MQIATKKRIKDKRIKRKFYITSSHKMHILKDAQCLFLKSKLILNQNIFSYVAGGK